jgi:hypothetical protein
MSEQIYMQLNSAQSIRIGKYNIDIQRAPSPVLRKIHGAILTQFTDTTNRFVGPFLLNLRRAADSSMNASLSNEDLRVLIMSFCDAWWDSAKVNRTWGSIEPKVLWKATGSSYDDDVDNDSVKADYDSKSFIGSKDAVVLDLAGGLRIGKSSDRLSEIRARLETLKSQLEACKTDQNQTACITNIQASVQTALENDFKDLS